MADVDVSVAFIAGAAGVLGAAVGSLAGPIAENQRANREAKEVRRNLYADFLGLVDTYRRNDLRADELMEEAATDSGPDIIERLLVVTAQVEKAGMDLDTNTNHLVILAKPEVRDAMALFGKVYGITEDRSKKSRKLRDNARTHLSQTLRADLASWWTSKIRRKRALRDFKKFYESAEAEVKEAKAEKKARKAQAKEQTAS